MSQTHQQPVNTPPYEAGETLPAHITNRASALKFVREGRDFIHRKLDRSGSLSRPRQTRDRVSEWLDQIELNNIEPALRRAGGLPQTLLDVCELFLDLEHSDEVVSRARDLYNKFHLHEWGLYQNSDPVMEILPSEVQDREKLIRYIKQEINEIDPLENLPTTQQTFRQDFEIRGHQARIRLFLQFLFDVPVDGTVLRSTKILDTLAKIKTQAFANCSAQWVNNAVELHDLFSDKKTFGAAEAVNIVDTPTSANASWRAEFSHMDVQLGQWFPSFTNIAHSIPQRGTHGWPIRGVFSIVVPKDCEKGKYGGYNVDRQDTIHFAALGSVNSDDEDAAPRPNRETFAMYSAVRTGNPIRVMRTLGANSFYYCGLYRAVGSYLATHADTNCKFTRFVLVRDPVDNGRITLQQCKRRAEDAANSATQDLASPDQPATTNTADPTAGQDSATHSGNSQNDDDMDGQSQTTRDLGADAADRGEVNKAVSNLFNTVEDKDTPMNDGQDEQGDQQPGAGLAEFRKVQNAAWTFGEPQRTDTQEEGAQLQQQSGDEGREGTLFVASEPESAGAAAARRSAEQRQQLEDGQDSMDQDEGD